MQCSRSNLMIPFLFLGLLVIQAQGCGGTRTGETRTGSSFTSDYQAISRGDATAQERFLERTRSSEADNPEWYVTAANFYFSKSDQVMTISTKPPEPGDLVLTDQGTGQVAGSISQAPVNAKDLTTANAILREGSQRFPERLDLRFGLAHILQSAGEADQQIAVLEATANYAAAHAAQLHWVNGTEVPSPAEQFIPETLQEYAKFYFDQESPTASQFGLAIAQISIRYYPRHPYAYNSLAGYWYTKNDLTQAASFLHQAYDLDPSDSLVIFNLANISAEQGNATEARRYFDLVIASANAGAELRAAAEEKRNALTSENKPATP